MGISLIQHQEALTKRVIRQFSDANPPRNGLAAFFPGMTTIERELSIQVRRSRQLIAVDVHRQADGNVNTFDTHSEKIYVPPMYNERWNFTDIERYNVTFGNMTNPSTSDAINMLNKAMEKTMRLREKIERAKEKQRAEILQTGIVQLQNGDNIDYKRQADSLVVKSGSDVWTNSASDPLEDLKDGAEFIRQQGLSVGNRINVILGQGAFEAFMRNPNVVGQNAPAEFRRISRLEINMPQFDNVTGMVFHGTVATADYELLLWTYNDFYEVASGTKTKYINDNRVIMIAEDFEGVTGHAGIPAIQRDISNAEFSEFITPIESEMHMDNYLDKQKMAHWFRLRSAPLAIPVSIDRIWSAQVLA